MSTEDTKRLVSMSEAVEELERVYRDLGNQEAVYRPRSDMVVPLEPRKDYWLATMEGASRRDGLAAIRLRSDVYVESLRHGVRTAGKWAGRPGLFCGLVVLYDIRTAEPLAIINDGYLQVMRVAATSAVAGRYLARVDSRVLGIIGAGWQAKDHARAYAAVFPIEQIKVYCRTPETRESFAAEISRELGLPVAALDSPEEVVAGSDIVAACTTAQAPVLRSAWVDRGAYVSCIRFYREIAPEESGDFDVHVAHPGEYGWSSYRAGTPEEWASGTESVDLYHGAVLPPNAVSLQEVVVGRKPGRTDERQRTLFNNHAGMGVQFVALGGLAFRRAVERGIGRELPTEWFLQDITT